MRAEIEELRTAVEGDRVINTRADVSRYSPTGLVKYSDPAMAVPSYMPVSLEDTEKDTIIRALERNGGSRKNTARELNISERTLYRKIREYGLDKK